MTDVPGSPRRTARPPRALGILIGLAATVIACAGLRSAAEIVAPTFLALTLVITVHPLQRWLVARRVPRLVAGAICLLVLYAVVIGLVLAMVWSVVQLGAVLPAYQSQFVDLYQSALVQLDQLGLGTAQLELALDNFDFGSVFAAVQGLLSQLLGATSLFVLLLVVLLFLGFDAVSMPRRLLLAAKANPPFVAAMDAFAVGIRRYWLVTSFFGLIVAVLDVVALVILNIPLALLWGLVSFITNFIPNIGFVLGLVPPALLALLEGGVPLMLWVVVLYSVLNFTVQTVIQPRFTGDAVGVTAAVSFLSLVFWAFILGPLGALLALPATLFVKTILVDGDPEKQWINTLISARSHAR